MVFTIGEDNIALAKTQPIIPILSIDIFYEGAHRGRRHALFDLQLASLPKNRDKLVKIDIRQYTLWNCDNLKPF